MKALAKPKKKTTVRGIFFDLGNVLVRYDASITARKLAEACHVSPDEIWSRAFTSDLERAYTKGEISSEDFFRRFCQHFPSRLSYGKFCKIWNEMFFENEGMEGIVKRLKKKYPLYLISNTNELHFEYIKKQFPILRHFRRMFPSHEVGHRKPEPAIFLHALQKTGLKPSESLFIDDMPQFVEAAGAAGMQTIRFQSVGRLRKELCALGLVKGS